jgi:AraC-like DNA-binding protein
MVLRPAGVALAPVAAAQVAGAPTEVTVWLDSFAARFGLRPPGEAAIPCGGALWRVPAGGGAGLMPGPETGPGGPVTATLPVDAWLRERAPAAEVAGMLRCAWRGDLGAIRTPLPDECFDLFWVDDGSLWLSGPESASWAPCGHPPARNAVGVRCLPGAGPSLFGIAASEVRDLRVRLDDLWPCSIVREVSDRMASQASDHARMRELERAVVRLAAGAAPVDRLALALAAEVGIARPGPARAIARSAGLSERQIHRRCTEAFGYGPAVLARILRLQRALHLARSGRRPPRLADLAVAAGYADQQHLAHDVRALTGTTASALLAVSDPYKTAHPAAGDDDDMSSLSAPRRRAEDTA